MKIYSYSRFISSLHISFIIFLALLVMRLSNAMGQGAGNALNFDGWDGSYGEYVNFGSAPELQITGDLTIEAWVFITSAPSSGTLYAMVTYGNHRTTTPEVEEDNLLYRFYLDPNGNWGSLHEYGAGLDEGPTVASVSMIYGEWVHLTVIRTGGLSPEYQFLRNGMREGPYDYINEPTGGSNGIAVLGGGFATTGTPGTPSQNDYLIGIMDEVRVWNAALSFWDVRQWMNRKINSNHPNFEDLVGYWRLDDAITTTDVADQTGNNDGTLINMETGSGGDRILSTAPIGDACIFAVRSDQTDPETYPDIESTSEVPIDVTFGTDPPEGPGLYNPLAVIQVNEAPNTTSGLLTFYPNTYWELWARYPFFDDDFTATVQFNYDFIGGIGDEANLSLYRRDDVTDTWSAISASLNAGVSNSDGIGYFEIIFTENTPGGFSGQYIVTSSDADNPLPVELATFTANLVDNAVKLEWVTHSEVNNQGFEIWRDIDQQKDFRLIASYQDHRNLVGAGNSSTTRHYQYLDKNILPGHAYAYQLWEVSYAGERNSYGPVSLNLNNTENLSDQYVLFQNYPNPFNPITYIRFQIHQLNFQGGNLVPVSLDVYDLLGKKIKSLINSDLNVGDYTHSWDGTDETGKRVASGTYIYQLKLGDQLTSKKLMLIR